MPKTLFLIRAYLSGGIFLKKLILFCPLCNSTSIKSIGSVLFFSAPIAEFSADHVDPRLFTPSKGWPAEIKIHIIIEVFFNSIYLLVNF